MRELLSAPYRLLTAPTGPFAMNQYLLVGPDEAMIVDCGGAPEPFLSVVREAGTSVKRILLTHAHVDHVLTLEETRAACGKDVPVHLHEADLPLLEAAPMQAMMFGVRCTAASPPDALLEDGETIAFGDASFRVLHTPGHAPGHCSFYDEHNGILLVGDLLFAGSIGRLDLPGCDVDAMKRSLRRILELDDAVRVFPGHMEPTTIGNERRHNPFLRSGMAW